MNKHTLGPWLYRGKSDSVHEACDTHPFGRQIFRFVEDEAPSDEDISLILAAPDLLEALIEVTASLAWNAHGECRAINDGPIMPSAMAIEVARAAIAKAKGESV